MRVRRIGAQWRRGPRRPVAYALGAFGAIGIALLLATSILLPSRQASGSASQREEFSSTDAYWLTAARERLIQACMRGHGYHYTPFLQDQFADQLFPLVLTDPRWARTYGFGGGTSAVLQDPNHQRLAHRSRAEQKGFYLALDGSLSGPAYQVSVPGGGVMGESATGCYTDAQQRLYGSAASWFGATTLASLARMTIMGRVRQDPRFQSAASAWSTCMARHGLQYPSPQVAKQAATTPGTAPGPGRIAIAVAESLCARQTPLARISAALYSKEERRLPTLLQTALRVELRLELSSVSRAISIASGQAGAGYR